MDVTIDKGLPPEVIFIAKNLVDRFFACSPDVPQQQIQLVGCATILIADKQCEGHGILVVSDLTYLCEDQYTDGDLIRMEMCILKRLSFDTFVATELCFACLYMDLLEGAGPAKSMIYVCSRAGFIIRALMLPPPHTQRITELSLLDYECLQFLPNMIAAAAVFIALQASDIRPCWVGVSYSWLTCYLLTNLQQPAPLEQLTRISISDAIFRDCVLRLFSLLQATSHKLPSHVSFTPMLLRSANTSNNPARDTGAGISSRQAVRRTSAA